MGFLKGGTLQGAGFMGLGPKREELVSLAIPKIVSGLS